MYNNILSVQFNNYSETPHENLRTQRQDCIGITTEKDPVDQEFSGTRWRSSWVANRTIFEMRKTELQVCQRAWTWSQALFINQSSQKPARDVLRTQRLLRTGPEITGQIRGGTRSFGRNQRYQCRTNSSTRGVVNDHIDLSYRYRSHRCTAGQCVAITSEAGVIHGGNQ